MLITDYRMFSPLHQLRYTSPSRLAIEGRSAGGLLMGAVTNMRPDLFNAVIMGVPFVDVLTTMLDASIPLTTNEWEEWGDPRRPEYYYYMKSYSPVDNVAAQRWEVVAISRLKYFQRSCLGDHMLVACVPRHAGSTCSKVYTCLQVKSNT
jgi:protease II